MAKTMTLSMYTDGKSAPALKLSARVGINWIRNLWPFQYYEIEISELIYKSE